MTTATTTGPLQREKLSPRRNRRPSWAAAAAASVAAATVGALLALDGSSTEPPASASPTPVAVTDQAPLLDAVTTSADAAERRSIAALASRTERCTGLSADAAERCMSAG